MPTINTNLASLTADYAVETAKLTQQQILQDAGTTMLAQAHSVVAEQALALLKDV